jgi:hypothetical protein
MTVMERFTAIRHEQKVPPSPEAWPRGFEDDPRWTLAQRVVAGSHFARSLLLSKFLLYVVAETLEGRESEITEHQIGMQVFDRRPGYSTVEDNIVRNYARQLRRRLAAHFAGEGSAETMRIDIPLGAYVPIFVPVSDEPLARKTVRSPFRSTFKPSLEPPPQPHWRPLAGIGNDGFSAHPWPPFIVRRSFASRGLSLRIRTLRNRCHSLRIRSGRLYSMARQTHLSYPPMRDSICSKISRVGRCLLRTI